MLDVTARVPSQPVHQQLGDQDIEQAIGDSMSGYNLMPYSVLKSIDLNDAKSPMGWLDSHRLDSFNTLPSKVTQNFITIWNLCSMCVIRY